MSHGIGINVNFLPTCKQWNATSNNEEREYLF